MELFPRKRNSLQENIDFETTICNQSSSYKILQLISNLFATLVLLRETCHKLVANMQQKCAVAIWLVI